MEPYDMTNLVRHYLMMSPIVTTPNLMGTAATVLAVALFNTNILNQDLSTMGPIRIVALEIRDNILELLAFIGKVLQVKGVMAQFLAGGMVELLRGLLL